MFRRKRFQDDEPSSLAEFGLEADLIDEMCSAVSSFPDWPDLASAPAVTAEEWKAARLAIRGLPMRSRALRQAADDLAPISRAVGQLGVSLGIVDVARLAKLGTCVKGSYVVFAHRADGGVRFTTTWTPQLMSDPSM